MSVDPENGKVLWRQSYPAPFDERKPDFECPWWAQTPPGARSNDGLAIEIKPVLLPVNRPAFLDDACLRGSSDPKPTQRQDHGANADARVCTLADLPAAWTFQNRRANVPFRSDPLKLRAQFIAQFDECLAGHALIPLRAQALDHFRKPDPLCITCGHRNYCIARKASQQTAALCNIEQSR